MGPERVRPNAIILKPPDTTEADRLEGWTDDDWMVSRGSLELWRCQLNRKLTRDELSRVREAFDAAIEDHNEVTLVDFWKVIGLFKPQVLVTRWRCDPEHRWTRMKIGGRNWGKSVVLDALGRTVMPGSQQ